jgi:imidazolonepropionase
MNDLGIIEDGSVLIKNSEIAAVGPTRRLENLKEARNAAVIPATGRVVLPGFVDARLHLIPGRSGRSARGSSLIKTAQEAVSVLRSALHHGTTRAEVKIGGGPAADEVRHLRHLKRLDASGHEVVQTWVVHPAPEETPESSVKSREHAFEWLRKRGRSPFLEVVTNSKSWEVARAVLSAAAERGMTCKLAWRGRADEPLTELLGRFRFHAVTGLEHLEPATAEYLAKMQTTFVFSGGTDLWSKNDTTSARAILDNGGAVAIASGYDAASSPVFNMQMVIAQAVLQMKMTTEEAITAATINAAYASGVEKQTGSLEYKKQADLLILSLADYRELPRQFGINHVGMAIRAGSVVFNRIGWKAARPAS